MKMKKVSLTILSLAVLGMVIAPVVLAQTDPYGLKPLEDIGLTTKEVRSATASMIQSLLGVLGILALIIVLIGGFRWMTSGGNEENVAGAKKTIGAGLVGLAIILFAYAIVAFIFNVLGNA